MSKRKKKGSAEKPAKKSSRLNPDTEETLPQESEMTSPEESDGADESELTRTEKSEVMLAEEADSADEDDADADALTELESEEAVSMSPLDDEKNMFEELVEAAQAAESDDSVIDAASLEGSELDSFESAAIEDVEFVEDERLESILEAMLFASDRPISFATFKMTFKGTNIRADHIRRGLERLATEYAGGRRGIGLEEVPGGYQLRTKLDNMKFLTRTLKVRPFKLSGPALEVLSIVAYKQPVIKSELDDIRGVESGHLLRALMEKGLVQFEGKSDFPGRPMLYGTSKKFLEIFGLRNLKELPTLSQIDELLPEGIGDEIETEKTQLADVTDQLSQEINTSYSDGEEELLKISATLQDIDISSDFFEKEKLKQRESRDAEKAANLREAVMVGESIPTRDRNWLERYDEALASGTSLAQIALAKDKARLASMKPTGPSEAAGTADTEASATPATAEGEEVEPSISGELSALSFADEAAESDPDTESQSETVRFEEEEDISLDQDLNVPFHDDEDDADDDDKGPEAQA